MVLPAPPPDDPQDPEDPGWADRVARLVGLAERGILILVDGAVHARLRELVLALLPEHPQLEVHTDPRPLLEAPPRAVVVLAPHVEHAGWLNLNRPLFAERQLRVVLFCDEDVSRALARQATDFFDWVSHHVACPPGLPWFAVAGIRASVVARAPGVAWDGEREEFEAALARAFSGRKVQWFGPESSEIAMLLSAKQRGPDWLGFEDPLGGPKLGEFLSVLGALRTRGRAVLIRPPRVPAGWPAVHARVAGLSVTRARLAEVGARHPGRLSALSGLEPEGVDLLEALLKAGAAETELDAALRDAGDPGAFLARAAAGRGMVDRRATVAPVLRAFAGEPEVHREHVRPALPAADAGLREAMADLQQGQAGLERLYRQTLVDQFKHLTFKGMSRTGAISLPLDKVYVELKAVADVPEAADTYSADELRMLIEAEQRGLSESETRMQLDSLRLQRWTDDSRKAGAQKSRRSIGGALADPMLPGVVILGDPGSGKTTLLHYLALLAARGEEPPSEEPVALAAALRGPAGEARLPIFVPLAAYDNHVRRGSDSPSLREYLAIYYEKRLGLPGMNPLFQKALEAGRALVLLDGLDEVLDVGMRIHVANQASALCQQEARRGNRFVVTSRFVGYREAPLSGDLHVFSVMPFGEEEIQTFAHQWCEAYEVWAAGGVRSEVVLQNAGVWERALLDEVKANPSVLKLAANPLLLTMLALLRRQGGKLPEQRVKLYHQYVETLLDNNWEHVRSEGARDVPPERFDQELAMEYLIELALWMQQHMPSGTASRHELESELLRIGLRCEGHQPDEAPAKALVEARRKAAWFLKDMRHFAGLLAERGRDAYGFLHLTFQEYFAGRALARMAAAERWEVLKDNLHRPRWKEPILLCAGWLGIMENRRRDVTDLVRRILEAKSPYEELLHRDVFLASDVAVDGAAVDKALLDEVTGRLEPLTDSRIGVERDEALKALVRLTRLEHEGARAVLEHRIRRSDGHLGQ